MKKPKKDNSIELIQNLKNFKSFSKKVKLPEEITDKVLKRIYEVIGQTEETIKKRLSGLTAEDEFLLLSLMLGNIQQITRLEGKRFVNEKTYTIPDFLVAVNFPKSLTKEGTPPLSQRFFLEVKKNPEGEKNFIITKEAYQKSFFYSELYTLPLYFGIKFSLPEINFSKWLLVPINLIKKHSKVEKVKVHKSVEEESYIVNIFDLFKENYSDLWLDDFTILIPKGFTITKTYDKKRKSPIGQRGLGNLIEIKITYGDKAKKIVFEGKTMKIEDMASFAVIKTMSRGVESSISNGTTVKKMFKADENYFVPLYHIMLDVFLHIRGQFQIALEGKEEDISFYLNNFSQMDENLISIIRNAIYELDGEFIKFIRMMPKNIMDKVEKG